MTDDEGIGTEGEQGIPVWLALRFAGLILIGFVIALVTSA
jgi:succinate dehydrogenase hydrophobic anchor subunit